LNYRRIEKFISEMITRQLRDVSETFMVCRGQNTELFSDLSGDGAAVPEPSAVSLLVVGMGGVMALRRCRRSAV